MSYIIFGLSSEKVSNKLKKYYLDFFIEEHEMKDDYTKDVNRINKIAWIAVFVMVLLWITTWILTEFFICIPAERGTFGDMFGSVNALFSGIALAGVIYTILLQRIELRQNTTELRGQKEQLARQNETMDLQKFETSFFQLLSFHHKLLDAITYTPLNRKLDGSKALEEIYVDFSKYDFSPLSSFEEYAEHIFGDSIGLRHYFNNLYYIVKFIHEDKVYDKWKYIGILRSQLSTSEQALLFYNCLGNRDSEKFKSLIEEYALFENMDYELLINKIHIRQYDLKAFGDDDYPKKNFENEKD